MILAVTIDDHNRRVTELIEANNREAERRLAEMTAERDRLRELLNAPEVRDFLEGAIREAAHQVERWGAAHWHRTISSGAAHDPTKPSDLERALDTRR